MLLFARLIDGRRRFLGNWTALRPLLSDITQMLPKKKYRRRGSGTIHRYHPFGQQDLRLRGARAKGSAERIRKQVLNYYKCFDDWHKIKKVEKITLPFHGSFHFRSHSFQSNSKSHLAVATPSTVSRDCIINSGASVNLISRKLLSEEEWSKRKRLSVPVVLRTANSKVVATHATDVSRMWTCQ